MHLKEGSLYAQQAQRFMLLKQLCRTHHMSARVALQPSYVRIADRRGHTSLLQKTYYQNRMRFKQP